MAQPSILGEGTTQRVQDTRWRLLVKIVGAAFDNATSPDSTLAPAARDTRWSLLEKWDRIRSGWTAPTPAAQSIMGWSPSSISSAAFSAELGYFAYVNATALPGVTSLTFNGATNRSGIFIAAAPDLVSFSAPNLTALTDTAYLNIQTCPLLTSISLPVLASIADFLRVDGCALPAANVNALLAMLVAATGADAITPWQGNADFSGGTNAAPTGQGILDKATLNGRGATVTTN
jgi:hypothetical protein